MSRKTINKIIIGITIVSLGMSNAAMAIVNETTSVKPQYSLVNISKNDKDLVVDGGFEQRTAWKKTGDGTFTSYAGTAATGSWCGLLPSNSGNASVYQVINVKPNTEYIAKAKVLLANQESTAFLNIKTPDVSTLIGGAEKTITCEPGSEWQYQNVELKFNSGSQQQIALCVMKWTTDVNSGTYKGQVYVDDVQLFENSPSIVDNSYNIIWADDFNSTKLDLSNWEYELGTIRGIEQQHYVNSEENVLIRDNGNGGELVLKATDRPKELQYNNPRDNSRKVIYNSGSVRTHGKSEFLYGRIEMRAKLPKGKSVFPAFWTLGSDFTIDGDVNSEQGYGWPRTGEVDIMELIGSNAGGTGNRTVYQTLHTSDGGDNYHKLGGTSYTIPEDFNDEYHIFGIDWSKGKIQWYVDDKIVATVDYSNDPIGSKCLDRPQYIQMNLAMGGAWPGAIAEGLAGTEYAIDYVYYAQNDKQKADAEEYYRTSPKITKYKDVSIYEGDTDVLSSVEISANADIDFSVTDAPQFSIKERNASTETAITSVDLLVKGKNDLSSLAKLPVGEYSLYYTALSKDLKFDVQNNGVKTPSAAELYKFDRKGVNLTIKERSLITDLEDSNLSLNGYTNNTLETVALPEGWTWDQVETIISENMPEVSVTFNKNGFVKTEKVRINVSKSEALMNLENVIVEASKYLNQTDIYTSESLEQLKVAINNANITLDNQSSVINEEIIKINEAVNRAINKLVRIEKVDEQQPSTEEPTKTEKPIKEEEPANTEESLNRDNKNINLVETGDMSSLGAAMTMLIVSGTTSLFARRRKQVK